MIDAFFLFGAQFSLIIMTSLLASDRLIIGIAFVLLYFVDGRQRGR